MCRREVVAGLLIFACACSAGDDGGHDPAGPDPDPIHDLVYEGEPGGPRELMLLRDGATDPVRLFPPYAVVAGDPSPSPDGRLIAFVVLDSVDAGEVFVANRDGSGLRNLSQNSEYDTSPAFSPDGTQIAFRSTRESLGDIFVINLDGSGLTNLTPDARPAVTDEDWPAWSPDGLRLAFASNRGGTWDIWTMARDGSDLRQITNSPDFDGEPCWSPDGTSIVFRRSLSSSDLAFVSSSGGEVRILQQVGEERAPAWSPDGTRIAFSTDLGVFNRYLHTIRPDGSELRRLIPDYTYGDQYRPAWFRRV